MKGYLVVERLDGLRWKLFEWAAKYISMHSLFLFALVMKIGMKGSESHNVEEKTQVSVGEQEEHTRLTRE